MVRILQQNLHFRYHSMLSDLQGTFSSSWLRLFITIIVIPKLKGHNTARAARIDCCQRLRVTTAVNPFTLVSHCHSMYITNATECLSNAPVWKIAPTICNNFKTLSCKQLKCRINLLCHITISLPWCNETITAICKTTVIWFLLYLLFQIYAVHSWSLLFLIAIQFCYYLYPFVYTSTKGNIQIVFQAYFVKKNT